MKKFIASIDQGTTSTRCMIFNHAGETVAISQKEHQQIYPQPGWVEHDPMEIWQRVQQTTEQAIQTANIKSTDLAAIGITNQRETTVVWDKTTGRPLYNAIVWQDTRTHQICNALENEGGQDRFRESTGLPIATYFSGPKIKWLIDNIPGIHADIEKGNVCVGTIDSWLVWNLTGGVKGGIHVTDVTNASRTMLMNLHTLDWDIEILRTFGIPRLILPEIVSSSFVSGITKCFISGVPIAGILGDQQAALFGQTCFHVGEAKNTYGTGCFMLLNTGNQPVTSKNGLLTTLGYQIGHLAPVYCLEGSIAITGALVQWLRDNLGIIEKSSDIEELASSVKDNGGIYFVPAFSGLFAPYWRNDARGVLVGLTRFITKAHIARAALEATAFQTKEVLDAMEADSGVKLTTLKVDGGMVFNELLMQFQSDILNVPVVRSKISETTALGAAYAAGLAIDFWRDVDELKNLWKFDHEWKPSMSEDLRRRYYQGWKKAVLRSFDWVEKE